MNLLEISRMYTDLSEYVDVVNGLNRIMKNKKVYSHLLSSFAQNTHYDELSEQLTIGNIAEAQKTAHIIKGLTANLSLPLAYELSANIEGRLKTGDADVLTELAELGTVINKTVEYIRIVVLNIDGIDI